jgi:hypothetical protein
MKLVLKFSISDILGIPKENLNLGTNIRLPVIKYFACPEILTDISIFEVHFRNSETISYTPDAKIRFDYNSARPLNDGVIEVKAMSLVQ